jgi:hypothetical protein
VADKPSEQGVHDREKRRLSGLRQDDGVRPRYWMALFFPYLECDFDLGHGDLGFSVTMGFSCGDFRGIQGR